MSQSQEEQQQPIFVPKAHNIQPSQHPIPKDMWLKQLTLAASKDWLEQKYQEFERIIDNPKSTFDKKKNASRHLKVMEEAFEARYNDDDMKTFLQEATIVAKEEVKPYGVINYDTDNHGGELYDLHNNKRLK